MGDVYYICEHCHYSRIKVVNSNSALPRKMFMVCVKWRRCIEPEDTCNRFYARTGYECAPIQDVMDPGCFPEQYEEYWDDEN